MARRPRPDTVDMIKAAELRKKIMQMRRDLGWTYQAIADDLGVALITVQRHVKAGLEELRKQALNEVEQLRDLELARIESRLEEIQSLLKDADPHVRAKGLTLWLSYSESRRKLLGVDAPTVTADIDLSTLNDAQLKALSEGKPIEKVLKMRGDT